jgi:hypothetical protein
MPNKSLAPGDLGAQDDTMTTKKNIRCLIIGALLLVPIVFGMCGCMGPQPHTPTTSTPAPYVK